MCLPNKQEDADSAITALFVQIILKIIEDHSSLLKAQGQKNVDSLFIFEILAIPHLTQRLGSALSVFVSKFPLELVLMLANTTLGSWLDAFPKQRDNDVLPPVYVAANLLSLSMLKFPKMNPQYIVISSLTPPCFPLSSLQLSPLWFFLVF